MGGLTAPLHHGVGQLSLNGGWQRLGVRVEQALFGVGVAAGVLAEAGQ